MNRNKIADLAGVSTATISRFFNHPHLLSREIRELIEKIIEENDYQPNILASRLSKKSKGKVAFIFSPSDSLFEYQRFQAIYYLLLAEINKLPLSLVLFTENAPLFNRDHYDKIIFFGNPFSIFPSLEADLIIFPDKEITNNENYIKVDSAEIGKAIAELFIPASKQVPLVLLPSGYRQSILNDIINSFNDTLNEYGVFPNPHHFIEGADSFESGQASTAEGFVLGLDFHSIIAFNQEAALGAISALKSEGMSYPFDLQVVHYGHPKEYYFIEHDITCLSDPLYLIVDNIIKFINGGKTQIQLSPLLIEGRTY